MQNEQPLAPRRGVNAIAQDLEISETGTGELAEILIVVARYVDHPRAVFGLAKDGAYDVVMLLRPVKCLAQAPQIDHIAHEVQILGVDLAKEVEQRGCVAASGAEVNIRDEDAANPVARILGRTHAREGCARRVTPRLTQS